MKKKILAVALTLTMVMTMFAGCGKKDSTYFKEVKDMCNITTGTSVTELGITYSGKKSEEIPEILKGKDGKATVKVKVDETIENDKKLAIKISLKLGQEADYTEIVTIAVDNNKLYVAIDSLIEFIKKIDANTATEIQTTLAQIGINGGTVSLDLNKIMEAMGSEMPEVSDDTKKSAYELKEAFFDALEKNYKDLQGQDGDDYTLTIDEKTADKAVDGTVKLLENDMLGLYDKFVEFAEKIYGEDSEISKQIESSRKENANEIKDAAKEVKDNKDKAAKSIKDSKAKIVSKASFSGKDGSKVGKLSFDTGDIESEDGKVNISIKSEMKEGSVSIKDATPKDATDLTAMLLAVLNQMQGTGAGDNSSIY